MKETLIKLRKEKGLTQAQVSFISGLSLPTVNRAENRNVKLKTYEILFTAINKYKG
jgi:transcriptional regulator with XRE-family HTH domain